MLIIVLYCIIERGTKREAGWTEEEPEISEGLRKSYIINFKIQNSILNISCEKEE